MSDERMLDISVPSGSSLLANLLNILMISATCQKSARGGSLAWIHTDSNLVSIKSAVCW